MQGMSGRVFRREAAVPVRSLLASSADSTDGGRASSIDQAATSELCEQCIGGGEVDRIHAGAASGLDVAGEVVNVEDAFDRMPQPTAQDVEDLGVGLGDAF